MTTDFKPLKGHCTCKTITYEVLAPFLFTHCCHCTWCQRESGAAFAINSIVEGYNFRLTSETKPILIDTPSPSGDGQTIARCPKCQVAVYSGYGDDGTWQKFVKAGTLDDESRKTVKPDVHIFTSTKVEWIDLTSEKARGVPILPEFYEWKEVWPKDSFERLEVLRQRMKEAESTADFKQ